MAMLLVLCLGVAVGDSVITMYGGSGCRVWHRQWRIAFGAAPPWHSSVPSLCGAGRPRGGGAARLGFGGWCGGEALLGARRRRGGAARCGAASARGGGVASKGPAAWRRGSVLGVCVCGGAASRCGSAAAQGGAARTRGVGAAAARPSGRRGGGHRRTRRCGAPSGLGGVAAAVRGGGDAAEGLAKRRREARPGARRRGASTTTGNGPYSTMGSYARIGTYCSLYTALSGGLIDPNRYLVHEGRFPHPMALTASHMSTSLALTSIILLVRPSVMPSVARNGGRLFDLYMYLIPIGCFFAFLQFMMETNVVLAFRFSALAGLQTVNRQRLFVILWVISGSSLCVSGELHFALTGFLLQLVSQFAECIRAVIAELVLSGNDYKLDSLSYAFFISPVCLAGVPAARLSGVGQPRWCYEGYPSEGQGRRSGLHTSIHKGCKLNVRAELC